MTTIRELAKLSKEGLEDDEMVIVVKFKGDLASLPGVMKIVSSKIVDEGQDYDGAEGPDYRGKKWAYEFEVGQNIT